MLHSTVSDRPKARRVIAEALDPPVAGRCCKTALRERVSALLSDPELVGRVRRRLANGSVRDPAGDDMLWVRAALAETADDGGPT